MRGSKANCFFVFSFHAISLHLCSLRSAGQILYIINWATQHFPFEGNTEVWLKVGSPVAFVEAGGEVYKD